MASAVNENPKDCEMWMDAYRALKDGQGTFGRKEWDQLLGHCMAVTDNPCITFSRELIEAYPDAKVVLTVRDSADAFWKSNMETIYAYGYSWHAYRGPLVAFYRWLQGPRPLRLQMVGRCWHDAGYLEFPEKGRQMYHEHNEMIRQLVPPEKLLVYNLKEGWEPLCGFLGEEVPEGPFPRVNDMEAFRQNAEFGEKMFRMLAVVNGLKLLATVGAVAAAGLVLAGRIKGLRR
ncbi:hypothetical protein GTA08_BOTSDO03742 [Neofusicoccum parvum]|uniref:Uncharacterized protein n=1 Tax=Neofusicoccum parvum TaxID=310453 RepID=A0ACB5S442_9PEZI|nr:hypothetical protein GTA08_BOTSDO03742 [Neofusicoccum parvum]